MNLWYHSVGFGWFHLVSASQSPALHLVQWNALCAAADATSGTGGLAHAKIAVP